MSTMLWAFATSIGLLASAVLFQLARRRSRQSRLHGLELKPNCLLTRYPIGFISGRKSIFRLFDHWNEVPSYLKEHGYEVLILEPVPGKIGNSLLRALDELSEKCHLIADSSSRMELEMIAKAKHPRVESLTLIKNPARRENSQKRSISSEDLRPLDSAIEIFEIIADDTAADVNVATIFSKVLLAAHNRWIAGKNHFVDALETCEAEMNQPWALESRFLELAVSLAERDTQKNNEWNK